jgi:hypothetical protein
MSTTFPGGGGTDVILPEGVSEVQVEVGVGEAGNTLVAVKKNTKDLDIEAKGSTGITGKKVTDTTVNVAAKKGEDANIVLQTTIAKNTNINNEGKSALEVTVNTGKVSNLTIDAGNKKRADVLRVKDGVALSRLNASMGKGNDKITIDKGATLKGNNTIDLGKGGKDSIVIKADSIGKAKLTITNFTKKDTLTVGDEKLTYKDIKNGAEIPNITVELA